MSARLPLALVVWFAAVAAAIALSSSIAGGIHPTKTAGGGSGTGALADPSSVRPADAGSMFRPANLAAALSKLRSHLGASTRVERAVIYPGYLSVTAVRGGSEIDVTDFANGTYSQISTGGSPGGDPLIPLARIDPRAPASFLARITRVAHVRASGVRYLVAELDSISHALRWSAYLAPGSRIEYLIAAGGTGPLQELTQAGTLRTLRG